MQYPQVNGFAYSWVGVEAVIAGNRKIGIGLQDINYTSKQEKTFVYGAGSQPVSKALGKAEYEADMTFLLAECQELLDALSPNALTKTFDIQVSYTDLVSESRIITDTLIGVTLESLESSASQGSSDALVRKLPLKPLRILYNGVLQTAPEVTGAA